MPEATEYRNRQRQDQLCDENLDRKQIHQPLDTALLVAALLRVHHDASLATGVYDAASEPFRVLQLRAFEQQLLRTQWEVALFSNEQVAIEGVEVAVWRLCIDLAH